jgi:hypothetical protein
MKNKFILNVAMVCGCIVSQTNADTLTAGEIQLLAEESRFKVQQLEDSLHRVHSLQEREELLARMIGYIVIADLTKATNADEVLTASYMAPFIPVDPTREFLESGHTIGKIDFNQLCYMLKPSEEMTRILGEKVEKRAQRNPGEQAAYRAALAQYIPSMGFIAQIFLAIQNGAVVPAFARDVQGIIVYPMQRDLQGESFFQKWHANIREKFVETEGERILSHLFFKIFKAELEADQTVDIQKIVDIIRNIPGQKNGTLSLSLELLTKAHPDAMNVVQALREALGDQILM